MMNSSGAIESDVSAAPMETDDEIEQFVVSVTVDDCARWVSYIYYLL
jgi:hypothetical protein